MDRLTEMATVLVSSGDARSVAGGVLDHLLRVARAEGGAVVGIVGITASMFVSRDLTLGVDLAGHIARSRAQLDQGMTILIRDSRLLPIMGSDGISGVLYLHKPGAALPRATQEWATIALATALAHGARPTHGHSEPSEELTDHNLVVRNQLIKTLEATQYNLARTARQLGVTRRTIYLRMERFGIERRKPRKILKPAPA